MNIRKANQFDVDEISQLMKISAKEFIVHEFTVTGKKVFLDSIKSHSISDFIACGFRYLVAEKDNKIIAVIGIKNNNHLYHLFVAKGHQGKGISRVLWEQVKKDCTEKFGINEFTVNSSNCAVSVYESFGFKRTAVMQEKEGVLFNPMVMINN